MENIQWLQEVEQRKESLLEDLFRLLRINSVRDDEAATVEAPVGPGPLQALEEFMKMAEEDGFQTEQFGPWAGRVEVGSGEEVLGILGHVDVVPVGTGWETDPFEPVIKDGRIYARGSSDDKGPTVAAYFAIKLLRELGVEFNKTIHLIVGTDEESGWGCMDYYQEHAKMPDFGFSPDAHFPIINGEKGNVSVVFQVADDASREGHYHLEKFLGGLRPNMVIQDAEAVISLDDDQVEPLREALADYVEKHPDLSSELDAGAGSVTIKLVGKAAHGSTPEVGVNAATYLAHFLKAYDFDQKDAVTFLNLLGDTLHDSFKGEKLGIEHHHEVMGDVSTNIGIANYQDNKGGQINCNIRYPEGTDVDTMDGQVKDTMAQYDVTYEFDREDNKGPHYVPADDPLVKTLLDVYHRQTGLPAEERTIGGGTYGRLMERGVAYGALFPDSIDTMHQANEFLALDDLLKATAIYAEAIYHLTR